MYLFNIDEFSTSCLLLKTNKKLATFTPSLACIIRQALITGHYLHYLCDIWPIFDDHICSVMRENHATYKLISVCACDGRSLIIKRSFL